MLEARSVSGGLLLQQPDLIEPPLDWKVVTRRKPTDREMAAMRFAWRVCKHVKSNAIVFAGEDRLLAVGGGQTSRVDSVKIASYRGGDALKGSAVASDAFFPFRRIGAGCGSDCGGGRARDGDGLHRRPAFSPLSPPGREA
jgi:phosphoribosylaminoimidazolecarboxamide formyltransferase/IMP cyclohydrolase